MPRTYAGRRRFVLLLFALAGLTLVIRAVDQQIFEVDFLQAEGAERYLYDAVVPAHRGLITDRNGTVLAVSAPVDSIVADPHYLRPDHPRLAALAQALGMNTEVLRERLARYSNKRFVYLKRRLPPARADRIMAVVDEQDLPGVHRQREYRRYYPDGEVFAHVVGFTNFENRGQEGLELAFDEALAGVPGLQRVLRDGRRRTVEVVESLHMRRPGKNLVLSLDQRLQYIAYRELKAAVRKHKAKAGAMVVLDVRTGEVLAMVNQPGYNPNGNRSSKGGRLLNRAVTQIFEPGSTMKPLILAAALDSGAISAGDRIDTGKGLIRIGKHKVSDHHPLGTIDLRTLLQKSSNVGAALVALKMPAERLHDYLEALGFGIKTGIRYPGEMAGRLKPAGRWARIEQATIAYGYALSTTVLQLARAYMALADDGMVKPVTLLRRNQPPEGKRVFKAEVARLVRKLMESVVEKGGTAPAAAIPGYRVAGKTGTVKKSGKGGYRTKRYYALFAGMVPASRPRLVAVVMLDEPRGRHYYGGQVAAPVFAAVMDDALRLLNVPPDALETRAGVRLAGADKTK